MKTKISILLFLVLLTTSAYSQSDGLKGITNMMGSQLNMGDVMGQLVNGVKSSAFTGGKTGKSDIVSMLSGVNPTDYLKYASIAGSLAGSLKGSSFLPGWADKKDGVIDQLTKAGSMADVAGGVSGLLGNLSPSVLSKGLKGNVGTLTTALGILSAIK